MTAASLGPDVNSTASDRCALAVIAGDDVTDGGWHTAKAVMIYSDEAIGK